jgi:phthalate 4,5-dioxygenase reductase subunit
MMTELLSEGLRKFKLIYLTRDAESTAFLNEFQAPEYQGKVQIHHDQGDASRSMDLWPVFEKFTGAHMYCCGPQPLMDSVRDMSGHWPASAVHFESFGADRRPKADDRAFQVVLHRSGKTLEVPEDQSILETLRRHHISISSSCKVGLLEGVADHRDMVLRDDEKSNHLMVCVSRAQSDVLVLDC